MNRRGWLRRLAISGSAATLAVSSTAKAGASPTNCNPTSLPVMGRVCARRASEIASSTWSIGGETLDRDFAVYDHYKAYLGALGAKAIRLQAGWAKCERERGVYDWRWLDQVVDHATSQSVRPWLQPSYGNTLYEGGGGTGLGDGLPSSAEALAAWDAWVQALVSRYQDRVFEWEIWNEPDLNRTGEAGVEAYAELYMRTARIIRRLQPQGKILALALAHDLEYAERFLKVMKERDALDLVDVITFHTYPRNPDDTQPVDRLRAMIARTGRDIELRQGETGSPSEFQSRFALSGISWTPTMQAKWNLRRMLTHHARGVPFNLFTLCDLHYKNADDSLAMNYKGLLATNPDQTVSGPKPSYRAAQHVFSIFDGSLRVIPDHGFATTSLRTLAVSGYEAKSGAGQVAAYWFKDAPPDNSTEPTAIDLMLKTAHFVDPILVDLLSGEARAISQENWSQEGSVASFRDLSAHDWPLLIAERSLITLDAAPASE